MRKTFPLEISGLKPPRVIDSIKHDVRKYLKRERRKALPEGVDYCDFACRVGPDEAASKGAHVAELNAAIDLATKEQWTAIYIEILARPGHRTRRDPGASSEAP